MKLLIALRQFIKENDANFIAGIATAILIALLLLTGLTGCHIPTYPKYIELEKDLVFEYCEMVEDCEQINCTYIGLNVIDCEEICKEEEVCDKFMEFPKGTKIYYE